jgi:hypothetical protein
MIELVLNNENQEYRLTFVFDKKPGGYFPDMKLCTFSCVWKLRFDATT